MNDRERILGHIRLLEPDVDHDTLTYAMMAAGSQLHLATAHDPLVTMLLEAFGHSTVCIPPDAELVEVTHRALEQYELCPLCIPNAAALVLAISDDELRDGFNKFQAVPSLRHPKQVTETLLSECASAAYPASALVNRYGQLRTMVLDRLNDATYEVPDRYEQAVAERADRTRSDIDEVHQLLFGDGQLARLLTAEHGMQPDADRSGNCIVNFTWLHGRPWALSAPVETDNPGNAGDGDASLAQLLQLVHAPQSLERDTAVVLPCWVADVLTDGSEPKTFQVFDTDADEVLDTALRLYADEEQGSLYADLGVCIETARKLHA